MASSRRQSAASSLNSSGTATPADNPLDTNNDIPIPPSEIVQAEITQARSVPRSYMDSWKQWWTSGDSESQQSETRLLKRLAFFRVEGEPDNQPTSEDPNPITARISQVKLKSFAPGIAGERIINTCSFTTPATKGSKKAVVMTHGYGAGLAFFYRNFKDLAENSSSVGRAAYAIDWLGMGRSSRPDPKELVSGRKATAKERVEKAERFFTDSLDEWREKMGIEQMTLIGHSLGGYLTAAYALKYPERVDRLILLSPAGIHDHPDKGESIIPDAEVISAAAKELNEPQTVTSSSAPNSKPSLPSRTSSRRPPFSSAPTEASISRPDYSREESAQSVVAKDFEADEEGKKGNQGLWKKAVYYMWEEGVSPFGLVRKLGPIGPMMVARYSTRRFAALPENDIADLHDYVWQITKAKGSSEYCITHLLAPGAHARWPIESRVHKLKIPVCFSYGDHDWMDIKGGQDSVMAMRKAGNKDGKVVEISHAGHHVYLDNAKRTNEMIGRLLKEKV